ncbi:PREDICTED: protein PHYTOCHROME KINASE SUBSTRATE 1 [Theobroma cacao]|uniref:Protein PHYTOCHROME KINASE SUBSTRATE 1 n=1 Tax=Theobroma cacao TaxID=3641 RepID=A0AB32VC57_THECC|nr:PREDICTED: protein PHYTOCHROME KINASE SUBSTRATE 1 [Theobroma cacao]
MSLTMDGEKRNTSLGEVSFSSYLSTAEEIFVHKLAEPAIQQPHPAIASNIGIHAPARLERNKTEEGEISVFRAEKYFNMKLDDDSPKLDDKYANKRWLQMENQVDLHQMTPRRWPGTPSVSSEASWNSQTALLRSFMRNRSENKQKKVDGRSFFSNLSCTGSCSDGKSVYVNQNLDHGRVHGKEKRKEPIQINHRYTNMARRKLPQAKFQVKDEFDSQSFDKMSVGSNREVYFGPPVLKPGLHNVTVKTQLDDPRKSLEVFGSSAVKKGDIAKNLERKLSMLTWDAIPNAPTISSISRSSQACDDIESDASSDLFEIDNISGSGQALFTRQESDGMSSCMTPYAPSETSIEWSVVTASAADSSFVSDYHEKKPAENSRAPGSKTASRVANAKVLPDKEAQKSRTGGMLGCKSHKAVMVAETAYRTDEKSKPSHLHHLPNSATPMSGRLLQADIKVKDLDFP